MVFLFKTRRKSGLPVGYYVVSAFRQTRIKGVIMRRTMICIFMLVWPLMGKAHGNNAAEYFKLGLESSITYKKIEYFTKALELDPTLAPAYKKRALFYYFQEKYEKVIEDISSYIKLVSNKSDAYRMLGMAYLKTGNYDQAIHNFDTAIDMTPEMTAAYSYCAEAYRLSGYPAEAIKNASRAIALKGAPRVISDAYKTRAKAYRELGQEDLAFADSQKSFELDPRIIFFKYVSSYASLEEMRTAGLFGLIGIAFIMVFGLRMKPPEKDE